MVASVRHGRRYKQLQLAAAFQVQGMNRPAQKRGRRPVRPEQSALALALALCALAAAPQQPRRLDAVRGTADSPSGEQAAVPCFAYLRGGDVWFQCGGRPTRVTRTARVLVFAVAGPDFALGDDYGTARVYSLPSGRLLRTVPHGRGGEDIWTSCGKIVWQDLIPGGGSALLPSGSAPSTLPCMHVVAPGADPRGFRISPDGRFLAYIQNFSGTPDRWKLCAGRVGMAPICADFDGSGATSVSNDGHVLFDAPWGGSCLVNWVGALIPLTPKPPPTYDASTFCTGIFTWTPAGRHGPFAEYADDPQWLSPAEAAALGHLVASGAAARLR